MSKELLKQCYQRQANNTVSAIVDVMCNQLSETLNGKQMLEVQKILKQDLKVDKILDMMVDFVVEDAKLSEEDLKFVAEYMQTDVAQRMIAAGTNLASYLQTQQETILQMIITEESMVKLEKVLSPV